MRFFGRFINLSILIVLLCSCKVMKEAGTDIKTFFSNNLSNTKPSNEYLQGKRTPQENSYFQKLSQQNIQKEQEKALRRQKAQQMTEQLKQRRLQGQ